jgi:hypothetical protein
MRSNSVSAGQLGLSGQFNTLRDDAFGASQLLPHQQLGILALPTNPGNNQTITLTINGTAVTLRGRAVGISSPGDFNIQTTAAATAAVIVAGLCNPNITTSQFVALSSTNQQLTALCGFAVNGTSITIYSQNNSVTQPQTSFTASTTVTSGTWTANTMALYVEPGFYRIGISNVYFAGGNTSTFTAPVSNRRIDLVTLDSSGTLGVVTGTELASPVPPTYPANKLVVCEVLHRITETIIRDWNDGGLQGYISNDSRPLLAPPYISDTSQVATQIFIPWIASPAQGDIAYFNGTSWTRLPAGVVGQVLQTGGPSANPSWLTTVNSTFIIGSGAGAYTTTSTSLADVDGTNLKKTVSGLSVGTKLLIRSWFTYGNTSNTGTAGLQLTDITNSATVTTYEAANGPASASSFFNETVYVAPSTSIQFSLQWKCGTNGTSTLSNSSTAVGATLLNVAGTAAAGGAGGTVVIWIQTIT